MQSRERTKRREAGRNGLAVPIALLALIVVGALVTGAFYVLSREPDSADTAKVSVGQPAAPVPATRAERMDDSIAADSLTHPADTSASGSARHPPLSANPALSPSVQRRAVVETIPAPAGRSPSHASTGAGPMH